MGVSKISIFDYPGTDILTSLLWPQASVANVEEKKFYWQKISMQVTIQ